MGEEFRWTAEQAAAITATGHTLLAASAGTGKTTTVIGKILWSLGLPVGVNGETGEPIPPCPESCTLAEVAAITFTEKAAYDLKRKLRERIAGSPGAAALQWELDQAAIGTIHGFCGDLIRENALRLGADPTFRILDERESRTELDEITRDVVIGALADDDPGATALVQRFGLDGWTHARGAVEHVRDALRDLRWHGERYAAWCRDGELEPARLRALVDEWDPQDDEPVALCVALHRLAARALERWTRFLEEENVRDFDSLILDTRALLTGPEAGAALAGIRRRYRILIIDEFQDTDGAQRDIAFAIAGVGEAAGAGRAAGTAGTGDAGPAGRVGASPRPQLFLVGDPKQSIYRFRGADVSVWNQVVERLCPDGRPLELTHNFRSDPAVVSFVNEVCGQVLPEVANSLAAVAPEGRVAYTELRPHRPSAPEAAGVEWVAVDGEPADERRKREGEIVAARIRDLVVDPGRGDLEGGRVVDPDTGRLRDCRYRDVAILFRTRRAVPPYEEALRRYGVPYYLAGDAGFTERLEVLDLLTVLRLIDNPRDDLRAFAYLRSPFVGLRDEVIARIRLNGRQGSSLLDQAAAYLEAGEWDAPEEGPEIVEVERRALEVGLAALRDAVALRSRLPLDDLLEEILDRTGYRLHLLLLEGSEPPLANVQRFLELLEGYRTHTIGAFLEMWRRWEDHDLGIPQAPLHSRDDDVVTLITVHSAKGLEWPVVFFADTQLERERAFANEVFTDPALGPILFPKKDDCGPRGARLYERRRREEEAEEARLLYVATTRARDRLVVVAPTRRAKGHAEWLGRGRTDAIPVRTQPPDVPIPPALPQPELAWLADVEPELELPRRARPLPRPPRRYIRSATELLVHRRSRAEWRLTYGHGVTPRWYFARESGGGDGVPERVRGTVIHGVLERIQEEAELAELLDETIGALDSPEMEERMAPGTEYRDALEREIAEVIGTGEWKWYVDGEHYRELRFVHLARPRKWRVGTFDLYRPDGWVIDFKTHEVEAAGVDGLAVRYAPQAAVYRRAAGIVAPVRVRFHFTRPNRAVEA